MVEAVAVLEGRFSCTLSYNIIHNNTNITLFVTIACNCIVS